MFGDASAPISLLGVVGKVSYLSGASASALLVFVAADFVGCCIENVQRRRFMERKGSMANELEAAEPAADLALAKSVAGWPMRV